jgi:catechol 2,3-dioxygenase-like lactoylglutathione lyase family enzyme
VQWISPHDPEKAYPIPVNHLGIHRTAFATGDIEADVATLKAQGVEFVSEITPCCSGPDSAGSIVAFYDPDGVIVELVGGQPFITEIFTIMRWFSD